MLGNVSEWTADALHLLGYGKGPLKDPMGYWWTRGGSEARNLMPVADYGGVRVKQDTMLTRGGNYQFPSSSNKVDKRGYVARVFQGSSVLGLRLARTLLGR
jgi:formylglycine-generating enzyme required for sulfatase activity